MGFSPVPEICLFPQNVFRIGQNSEIFLKINTSTIKSSKNINQTIHSTSFIFIFFGFFTFFSRLRIWFLEKITTLLCHSWSQILLSNHQSKIYNTIHVDMFCSLEKNKINCIVWPRWTAESKYSLDQMKSHCITLCKWPWLTLSIAFKEW